LNVVRNMHKQSLILTVLIFISSILLTGCQNEKIGIVDSIIKYGAFEGMYLGPTDSISPQWRNFEALKQEFSEQELIELCEHKDPIVRCYAFQALTELCSPNAYGVLLKHLSDTVEFNRNYGCIGDNDRVTDNFLDQVGFDRRSPSKYTLSDEQYQYIDSILLFRDEIKKRSRLGSIEYRSRRYVLERLKPLPHLHDRIKELVCAGVNEALPILAKYRDDSDTAIFISLLRNDEFNNAGRNGTIYVREAIFHFPHPAFYPVLKDLLMKEVGTNAISDEYQSYPLYAALVQYPTKETRMALETALNMSDEERHMRSRNIYFALKRSPSKVLEGLTDYVPQDWEK
jgi:hypothetical protein